MEAYFERSNLGLGAMACDQNARMIPTCMVHDCVTSNNFDRGGSESADRNSDKLCKDGDGLQDVKAYAIIIYKAGYCTTRLLVRTLLIISKQGPIGYWLLIRGILML